jgi:hypothetical protein
VRVWSFGIGVPPDFYAAALMRAIVSLGVHVSRWRIAHAAGLRGWSAQPVSNVPDASLTGGFPSPTPIS